MAVPHPAGSADDRFSAHTAAVPPLPLDPDTTNSPAMVAKTELAEPPDPQQKKSLLVFKRLRIDRPLPGTRLQATMLAVLFLVMILAGWNDSSQGPLLPSLQEYYHVNYLVISIIWAFNFLGFLSAGITNIFITDRFGFGIATPFGAIMQAIGYVLMCIGGPYPLFVFAFVINGFGLGLQDAQVNSLTSRLPNASTKMFLMHAVYGLGATVSPLVSTEFVKRVSSRVYLYYAVSLGLALSTVVGLILTFRFRTEDQIVGVRQPDAPSTEQATEMTSASVQSIVVERPELTDKSTPPGEPDLKAEEPTRGEDQERDKKEHSAGSGGKMKRIMKTPVVHAMAFYIMVYVGIEVTIGGWATTFIINERGGNDNAGYVTTGYFGGLTLGRVLLIPVTKWIGPMNSIYVYSAIVLALELVVWFTKSIPGNAVCFALIGFALGPMYPIVMMVVVDVLPGELQGGAIGWIASVGQAGSAIMPFITGAISNSRGIWILQPLVIAFLGFDLFLWFLVPRPKKGWHQ